MLHCDGIHPVVGGTGIALGPAADERTVFHPGDIGRVGKGEIAIGSFDRIQATQRAASHKSGAQRVVFGLGAVAPVDAIRAGERRDFGHPFAQPAISDVSRELLQNCFTAGRRSHELFLRVSGSRFDTSLSSEIPPRSAVRAAAPQAGRIRAANGRRHPVSGILTGCLH